jgi:hypothetical protein
MPEKRVADLFNITNRFLRSIHLERDFQDPSALSSYIPTGFIKQCLGRLTLGLKPQSGQRAWRITGDYGSGKSSLALFLAHWFNGQGAGFPPSLRGTIDFRQFGVSPPRFAPVLVTCSRQPLGHSIIKALHRMLTTLYGRGPRLKLANDLQRVIEKERDTTDDQVLDFILQVKSRLIFDAKAKGLLLILDELGKFLEFAALQPQQDVFLLQRLAEEAARSGDEPFFMVSLLHQGFTAYADHLTQAEQREWEKVAGRFEEIVFDQPIEQIAHLIASALRVSTEEIPRPQARQLKKAMEQALSLQWFGAAESQNLLGAATQLYPLHPTTLPVLVRFFRRFGQNERSLFGFLVSNEPFGLQSFSERPLTHSDYYRLHHFYDYVRANFGHRLALQSYRSHWNLVDSLIESFAAADELHVKVLKTVGVLNLLNDGDLLPTVDSIAVALAENGEQRHVRAAIEELRTRKRVLYDRGHARGLCLWPHTSVDIEKAYDDARRAVDTPQHVAAHLSDFLETRPIVARRHYIETGNLRYYNVHYCSMHDLAGVLEQEPTDGDGLIVVPLCETLSERVTAIELATGTALKDRTNWLIAVPQPLRTLANLVQELQRWEWVLMNTIELNADKYAREEVSRQQAAARSQLEKRVQHYVGFKQLTGSLMLDWFYQGRPLQIKNGRYLLSELSRILDETYKLAPRIHNELVNRRSLSSSAAAARMRLIERMFAEANSPFLGMNPAKKPPEMSMYLSVLQNTGLHQKSRDTWLINEPRQNADERCRILPSLRRMRELVQREPDARLNILTLFDELRRPPYGVRDGVIPLLLTVFAIAHEREVAFYKDGSFLRELTGETMLVLTKAPERFEIQYCRIAGVRAAFFKKLLMLLDVKATNEHHIELLDVVKKLCVFVAQLPQYVLNTKRLSPTALAVRDTVLNARDPAKLLFTDLPKACGFQQIAERAAKATWIEAFVKELKAGLDDLRASYPELQERLRKELRVSFDLPGSFQQFRTGLAARAEQILLSVTEPKLRAFCLRLMDNNLPEHNWLESVGSYLALKPPSKWHDNEEDTFTNELAQASTSFHRVESIIFASSTHQGDGIGLRVAITQANGEEHEQVVHVNADEEQQLRQLQHQFEVLLTQHRRLGIAAASRALWNSLERERKHE